jgi:DNA-binding FadR family transcriptional regulator
MPATTGWPVALQFHRRLVEASGNRTFLQTWDSFHWDVRARVMMRQIAALHGDIGKAYDTHLAIVERLRAGDGAGAALAVTTNFELFANFMQATGSQE